VRGKVKGSILPEKQGVANFAQGFHSYFHSYDTTMRPRPRHSARDSDFGCEAVEVFSTHATRRCPFAGLHSAAKILTGHHGPPLFSLSAICLHACVAPSTSALCSGGTWTICTFARVTIPSRLLQPFSASCASSPASRVRWVPGNKDSRRSRSGFCWQAVSPWREMQSLAWKQQRLRLASC